MCRFVKVFRSGESPLILAAVNNNFAAVKTLVRAGARIDFEPSFLANLNENTECNNYFKKKWMKHAASNLATVNEIIVPSHDDVQDMVKPIVSEIVNSTDELSQIMPFYKSLKLVAELNALKSGDVKPISELKHTISALDIGIQMADESMKPRLIEMKAQVEAELKLMQELDQSQRGALKYKVASRAIDIQQGIQANLFGIADNGKATFYIHGLSCAAKVAGSALSVFQNWNALSNIKTKKHHLAEVKTALNAAAEELNNLYRQITPDSLEGRLIKMKLGSIQAKIKTINETDSKLTLTRVTQKAALVGSSIACALMAYGLALYYGKYQSDDQQAFDVDAVVENAGHLSLICDLLPVLGPPIATGTCWLWNKGATSVFGQKETSLQREMRLDAKHEASLIKAQKALRSQQEEFDNELYVGIEISIGVLDKPEIGSARYRELTRQSNALALQQDNIANALQNYVTAKTLGVTWDDLDSNLQAIEKDLGSAESRKALKSVLKAANVDVAHFGSNPRKSILEYLR